jgi:hypothetical protein
LILCLTHLSQAETFCKSTSTYGVKELTTADTSPTGQAGRIHRELGKIMEIAYDHIQEEILAPDQSNWKGKDAEKPTESLNEEFQEAYKAISASPWGTRFGSFLGNVRKQVNERK